MRFLFLFLLLTASSCKESTDQPGSRATTISNNNQSRWGCESLQSSFASYEEAKDIIQSTSFPIAERLGTGKSSWIQDAYYYSCDGERGYFILVTEKKSYLYNNLPMDVWNAFVSADSKGQYYNAFIKGNYFFSLNASR